MSKPLTNRTTGGRATAQAGSAVEVVVTAAQRMTQQSGELKHTVGRFLGQNRAA